MEIKGKPVDDQTRCVHYHSVLDVIAIKFKCCREYYPCYECHQETADHDVQLWERTLWTQKAILCGRCHHEMTIHEYMNSHYQCPACKGNFNPGCAHHYHFYFEMQ